MDRNLETFLLLTWILAGFVYCHRQWATTKPKPDFCNKYVVINNTFLDVSYTAIINNDSDVLYPTWHRYSNHGQGNMAMTCPTGTQCGTTKQIWMNNTFPSIFEGPVYVNVCYKNETDCCSKKGRVHVENCGTFLIYFLTPQYPPVRWCFDNSLHVKLINSTEEASVSSIGLVAGAAGGGAVAVGVIGAVGTILFVRLKKKKPNTVDTSEQEANTVEKKKCPEETVTGYHLSSV